MQDTGVRIPGFGIHDSGSGSRDSRFGIRAPGFGFQDSGCGLWVPASGYNLAENVCGTVQGQILDPGISGFGSRNPEPGTLKCPAPFRSTSR